MDSIILFIVLKFSKYRKRKEYRIKRREKRVYVTFLESGDFHSLRVIDNFENLFSFLFIPFIQKYVVHKCRKHDFWLNRFMAKFTLQNKYEI